MKILSILSIFCLTEQRDFDAIESIIDDSEINTDQNFHQYISELEQRHQNHMNTMNDVIRNNF